MMFPPKPFSDKRGGPASGGGGQAPSLRAAVPAYVGSGFQDAPPGHRFRLYFEGWNQQWELDATHKKQSLDKVITLPRSAASALRALLGRQRLLAEGPEVSWNEGIATAPFTTGLGLEHPLENGFAFLDPYGLPYLPGSGAKGVVRRAAEELALFEKDHHEWSVPAVWWLFGFDAHSASFAADGDEPEVILEERKRWREALARHLDNLSGKPLALLNHYVHLACKSGVNHNLTPVERVRSWIPNDSGPAAEIREIHTRGALEFFDVIPLLEGDQLRVDIMNPHYGHYYQKDQPPGEWGNPLPIFFLTLPPGSKFTFIVRFRPPSGWPKEVREYFDETATNGEPRWRRLVNRALDFAFTWLGFGAKTAVGYGRFGHEEQKSETVREKPPEQPVRAGETKSPMVSSSRTPAPPPVSPPSSPSREGGGLSPELAKLESRIGSLESAKDIAAGPGLWRTNWRGGTGIPMRQSSHTSYGRRFSTSDGLRISCSATPPSQTW